MQPPKVRILRMIDGSCKYRLYAAQNEMLDLVSNVAGGISKNSNIAGGKSEVFALLHPRPGSPSCRAWGVRLPGWQRLGQEPRHQPLAHAPPQGHPTVLLPGEILKVFHIPMHLQVPPALLSGQDPFPRGGRLPILFETLVLFVFLILVCLHYSSRSALPPSPQRFCHWGQFRRALLCSALSSYLFFFLLSLLLFSFHFRSSG